MAESDKELCLNIYNGDETAFERLKKKHTGLVIIICKEHLEAGGLHLSLSINYKELVEDLSLIIWQELFTKITKGIEFKNVYAFKNLLRKFSRDTAVDTVRDSIKHRQQGSIQGKNNTFPRLKKISEDECCTVKSPEALFEIEEDEEKMTNLFYPLLLEKLNQEEKIVFDLIQQGIMENGKKPTQIEIGTKLGFTDRTIRTRMKSISEKASSVRESIKDL